MTQFLLSTQISAIFVRYNLLIMKPYEDNTCYSSLLFNKNAHLQFHLQINYYFYPMYFLCLRKMYNYQKRCKDWLGFNYFDVEIFLAISLYLEMERTKRFHCTLKDKINLFSAFLMGFHFPSLNSCTMSFQNNAFRQGVKYPHFPYSHYIDNL